MKAARLLKLLIRVSGAGALLLGLAFWAGYLRGWLPLHMFFGLGLVLSLWASALLAWRTAARRGLAGFALAWGLLVVWLGMMQSRLLVGSFHWIIALTHLLCGGVAIAVGVMLAGAAEAGSRRRSPALDRDPATP